ncbi:MAG: NUDIX hydrolase [Sphaerochaetaceae bacterium]|nr:NUDIX hydrolase [Candidatus Cloacimonadota bacterium]
MRDEYIHLYWKTVRKKRVFSTPLFDITQVLRESTDGRSGNFIEIDAPKWATVIPWFINEEGIASFVMVRQYRHGSNSVTVEFPAGIVEGNETPQQAALRELEEETGFIPTGKVVELGSVSPNPAFMNNRVWFYLVEGVVKEGEKDFDPHEQLDTLILPVEEVLELMGTSEFDNGIMVIAQAFFLRYAQNNQHLLG